MAAQKPKRSKPSVVVELMTAGVIREKGLVRIDTSKLEAHLVSLDANALPLAMRDVVLFAQLLRKKYPKEQASQTLLQLGERLVAKAPRKKGWR